MFFFFFSDNYKVKDYFYFIFVNKRELNVKLKEWEI